MVTLRLGLNILSSKSAGSGGGGGSAPVNTSVPSVSGNRIPGQVLTVSNGSWTNSPSSYTYKWYRNGVAIGGQTANTYTALDVDSELGNIITAGVVAINGNGSSSESLSANVVVLVDPVLISTKYWAADKSFQDDPMTTPSGNGQIVLTIQEQVGQVHNLDWIGTTVGAGVEKQNDNDYGDTQPYPVYRSAEGGFIMIRNATPKKYETQGGSLSIAGAATMYYYVRLTGGTDNEYFFFVSNGGSMRDRDEATGNTTQVGAFNTLATLTTGGRVLPSIVYRTAFLEIALDGAGNAQLYVNGVAWGESIAVGSTTMAEFCFGSNSHNANIQNFGGAIISGARDATKSGKIRKLWESKHGIAGSYPSSYPMVTFEASGVYNDKETYSGGIITAPPYVFRSPIGATEGATEFRLYTSQSGTQATALTQRTYVKTKIKGVDANAHTFTNGVDFTADGFYKWIEVIAVDSSGNRQLIETQTHGIVA